MKLDATTEEVYKLYLWMIEQDKQQEENKDDINSTAEAQSSDRDES